MSAKGRIVMLDGARDAQNVKFFASMHLAGAKKRTHLWHVGARKSLGVPRTHKRGFSRILQWILCVYIAQMPKKVLIMGSIARIIYSLIMESGCFINIYHTGFKNSRFFAIF